MPNYTTWNSADKSANITLSGGDLIATSTADAWNNVRSVLGVSNGKYYWELHTKQLTGWHDWFYLGVADSGVALDGEPGDDADGYIYRGSDGDKENNNIEVAFGAPYGIPDCTVSIALNMNAGKIWWALNGVWQNSGDPANGTNEAYSGISGVFYAIASIFGNTDYITANFGASAFSYSVPSGFNSGFFSAYIDVDVTNPAMTAEGFFSGQCEVTVPMPEAEGFTGITAEPSISMIRGAGTLSDNMTHIESSVIIPSMTAEITQAEQIWGAVSAPMITAELTERETVLGNVEIPMITAELSSGLHAELDASIPMMTAEGLFSGQCETTIPMITVEMEGMVGRVGDITVSIPMITVSMIGKTEHLGDIAVTVPMIRALAELTSGKTITGAATIPMMTAALSSYEEITGDITASIPMMVAYLEGTTARFTSCTVILRYEEPV